jgi:hypothetical protein
MQRKPEFFYHTYRAIYIWDYWWVISNQPNETIYTARGQFHSEEEARQYARELNVLWKEASEAKIRAIVAARDHVPSAD